MACHAADLATCLPRPGGTALAFVLAALVALGVTWGAAAVPAHLEAVMDLPPDTYAVADLLTLRGAVEEADLVVMGAVAASPRDFDTLVAQATADGHGSLQSVAMLGQ